MFLIVNLKKVGNMRREEIRKEINSLINEFNNIEDDLTLPYVEKLESLNTRFSYNEKFGDDRECKCGHSYYRHFDSYEEMIPIGCKYCGCYDFKEKNHKVLVIHPKDKSTDFLKTIYEDLDCTLIDYNPSTKELKEALRNHGKVIMLGHGDSYGLFGFDRRVIDSTLVYLLREVELVGVWCYANEFFEKYNLNGIYTGMVISEESEAILEGILSTKSNIDESNIQFALGIKHFVNSEDINDFHKHYTIQTRVGEFNRERIYIK